MRVTGEKVTTGTTEDFGVPNDAEPAVPVVVDTALVEVERPEPEPEPNPVADDPTLTVGDVVGSGDTSIPLAITSELTEPFETLSITIVGVPDGAILSTGVNLGGGEWSMSPEDLSGLTLIPLENDSRRSVRRLTNRWGASLLTLQSTF